MLLQQKDIILPDEYLEMERIAEYKSEYIDGEIFAMAGAGKNHNRISSNIVRALGNRLLDTSCHVYSSDMKVRTDQNKYTYPDIAVACEKEEYLDEKEDVLLNPLVIIEILSDSTEAYDRGMKFGFYQQIPTLKEYFLISQYFSRVEKFTRQNSRIWTYAAFRETDETIRVDAVKCELHMEEIYKDIRFTAK